MPRIKVNTSSLSGYENEMQEILSRVSSIIGQFESVSRNLDWDIKAESNINSRLSRISNELSSEIRGINGMKRFLGNSIRQYNAVEKRNKKNNLSDEVVGNGSGHYSNSKVDETNRTKNSSRKPGEPSFNPINHDLVHDTSPTEEKEKGVFASTFINKEAKLTGIHGESEAHGYLGGYAASASVEGDIGVLKASTSLESSFSIKDKEFGTEAKASASACAAKGKASASLGLAEVSATGSVLAAEASGAIGATLFKEGKLAPSVYANAKAEASVAKGNVEAKFGNDEFDIHTEAKGKVLTASANAGVSIGRIVEEDSSGNTKTSMGVKAEAGAEAYAVKGTISGGFTLFGIKIDAEVSGKAGGAGVKAGGDITGSSASGELGLGFLLGLGIKVNVDWSGFSIPD